MVDRQLDSPFDVSSENSLQTEKKGGKVLTFPFILKENPKPHRDASAQPLLVLQATSPAGRERGSFSKEQEQMQHEQ